MKFNEILIGALILGCATGFIAFQNSQINDLKNQKTNYEKQISELQSRQTLQLSEAKRLNDKITEYKNKKAEIEVRYVTKPVTKYVEVVKETPPKVVESMAKEELNEIFSGVTNDATDFSLRNPH
jgi:chromosome segregation ATPase